MIRNIKKRSQYRIYKHIDNDERYNSFKFAKFINYIMKYGKKELAKKIFYEAIDRIEAEDKINFIDEVITNLSINYDIRKYKAGGTNYFIPFPNTSERDFSVCARLIVDTARNSTRKKGKKFIECFVEELNNAHNKTGESYKFMQQKLQIVKQNMPLINMFKHRKKIKKF